MTELSIKTSRREQMIDVTAKIQGVVSDLGVKRGMVVCHVPHTTAGITINENADPDVPADLLDKLRREIPQRDGYRHAEGNSDAHLKSSLFGCSQTVLIEDGRLVLGTWQAVFFCEFDGPRTRRLLDAVNKFA